MTTKVNSPAGNSAAGLRGVAAATSSISDVNGEKGELIYQGFNIHDLAKHSTFEEVIFLLWNKRLPNASELSELEQSLRASYGLPAEIIPLMKQLPQDADPMDLLRTVVSALELYDSHAHDTSRELSVKTAVRLTAQFPTIVAAGDRIRRGLEPVSPDPELNIAANFLYMLRGEKPSERDARIFDVCLILHADHELNASTFTARVVAGTLADMYAAVTAAIGALSGPLHGGANQDVMELLLVALLLSAFAPWVLPYLLIQAVVGFSLLEVVNYLEHYGLLRQWDPESDRYEREHPGVKTSMLQSIFMNSLTLMSALALALVYGLGGDRAVVQNSPLVGIGRLLHWFRRGRPGADSDHERVDGDLWVEGQRSELGRNYAASHSGSSAVHAA